MRDVATLAVTGRFSRPGTELAAVSFSPDGTVLAVPLSAGRVTLWNLADPQASPRSLEGHGALALDAAFTPDGTMLATAGGDRRVRLWSVPDGTPQGELESESAVRAVAFSPDGTVLSAASQDYLQRLWSMPDRRLLALLNRHSDELNDVAFDDEGRLIRAPHPALDPAPVPDRTVLSFPDCAPHVSRLVGELLVGTERVVLHWRGSGTAQLAGLFDAPGGARRVSLSRSMSTLWTTGRTSSSCSSAGAHRTVA